MPSRCKGRAATGPPNRSMTIAAVWSAIPASRCRSARATRSNRRRSGYKQPGERASAAGFRMPSIPPGLALHVGEYRRRRPAIDLEAIGLLIGAERGAREHAGLAVDLVLVDAEPNERALHRLDLVGAQLRRLAPGRLERARIADAFAQVADEQHVEIGEIVFLDHVVILQHEEGWSIGALGQQQRCRLAKLRRARPPPVGRRVAALEPFADRQRVLRHPDRAIDAAWCAHLVGPARAALPALADELRRGGGER